MYTKIKEKLKMLKNKKIMLFIFLIVLIIVTTFFYTKYDENRSHIDNRETDCIGTTQKAYEYDLTKKECFSTSISGCQKATYSSIEECKSKNGLLN